jgi:hypothetical protein
MWFCKSSPLALHKKHGRKPSLCGGSPSVEAYSAQSPLMKSTHARIFKGDPAVAARAPSLSLHGSLSCLVAGHDLSAKQRTDHARNLKIA